MSLFHEAMAVCSKCGTETAVDLAASVNGERRPDLRQAILEGTFQATVCPSCGAALRLPAHLTYLDMGRGQWTLVESAGAIPDWRAAEQEARRVYELSFGPGAPDSAREIGEALTPRLVFGWPALREKIVCADLDLQDTTVELLKMSVIANVDGAPVADETELRLIGGDAAALNFAWIVSSTEQHVATLDVPRTAYEDIVEDADDWQDLRADLEGGLYVDMKRLVSG